MKLFLLTEEDTERYILHFYNALGLKVKIGTSFWVADVFFNYPQAARVRQYQAYIGNLTSPRRCSRLGDEPPTKCAIRGLQEATEYIIVARVCLHKKPDCEPPIEATARTKLRGSYTFVLTHRQMSYRKLMNKIYLKAPTASLTPISSTSIRLTFHPPKNHQADYYEANFLRGGKSTLCRVDASASPLACKFGNLKPDSFYEFDFYAGATASEHDIWSDVRQISGGTPPMCKLKNIFLLSNQSIQLLFACFCDASGILGLFAFICMQKTTLTSAGILSKKSYLNGKHLKNKYFLIHEWPSSTIF